MIKSVQSRLRDKGINLSVDLLVQAFDGLWSIYGARPLRRAVLFRRYISRTFIENIISRIPLQSRKKVEGTLMLIQWVVEGGWFSDRSRFSKKVITEEIQHTSQD
jgi:hypothetical protein